MRIKRFFNRRKRQVAVRIAIRLLAPHKIETDEGRYSAKMFIHENRELVLDDSYILNVWLDRIDLSRAATSSPHKTQMNLLTMGHLQDSLIRSLDKPKLTGLDIFWRLYLTALIILLIAQIGNLIYQFTQISS